MEARAGGSSERPSRGRLGPQERSAGLAQPKLQRGTGAALEPKRRRHKQQTSVSDSLISMEPRVRSRVARPGSGRKSRGRGRRRVASAMFVTFHLCWLCITERRPEGNQLGGGGEAEQSPPAAATSGESAHPGYCSTLSRQRALGSPPVLRTSRHLRGPFLPGWCLRGSIRCGRTRPSSQACEI